MVKSKELRSESGLISGALMLTVSVFVVKIIGYMYKLPLSHILGDEGMGYFNSAYSIFSFFYMLSLGGVPRAVAICVTEANVKGGLKSAEKILNLSLKIFLSIGITLSVILMSFSEFFARIIGNSTAGLSLFCIAPSLAFVSAAGVLRGYLNGIGRIKKVAVAEVLDGVSKFVTGLALAIIAARKNSGAPIIAAYTVIGVSIGAFIGAFFMFVGSKNKKYNEKTEQNAHLTENNLLIAKKIFKISVPITISSAIIGATGIIDLGMIMKRLKSIGYSESEAVALYGNFTTLVVPLLNLVSALVSPLATASMPHITKSKTLGKTDEYYELLRQILSLTAMVVFPVFFAYTFFADEILFFLFPDKSAIIAAPLLVVAAPSILFSSFLIMINTALEASGYAHTPLISMSAGALVKIACAYLLIGRLGVYGAPISTSACYFVAFIISAFIFCAKLKFRISFLRSVFIPAFASFVIFSVGKSIYGLFALKPENSLNFILFSFFLGIIYALFAFIFLRKRVNFLTNYVKIAKK